MLTPDDFTRLARARGDGCLSIYMRTSAGNASDAGPVQLGGLLREAESRAAECGLEPAEIERLLAPVRNVLDDGGFWRRCGRGLALFARDGALDAYRLPASIEDLVVAGTRFCMRPVLPSVDAGRRFHVLALGATRTRLLDATPECAREIDAHDVPIALFDRISYDDARESLQFGDGVLRPSGVSGARSIDEFVAAVDRGVCALLGGPSARLIVAATSDVASTFARVSSHPGLTGQITEVDADRAGAAELHRAALGMVTASAAAESPADRFEDLDGVAANATIDPQLVLRAAREAAVELLLVASDEPMWGSVGPGGSIDVHADRRRNDEDLLDRALATCIATGARVHGLPRGEMPGGSPIAAILRSAG